MRHAHNIGTKRLYIVFTYDTRIICGSTQIQCSIDCSISAPDGLDTEPAALAAENGDDIDILLSSGAYILAVQ